MEEQVIVTQGEGVPMPKETPRPAERAAARPPKPLQTETVVGAAVRAQLREILDKGPLTEGGVEQMKKIVVQSIPLLQAVMGADVKAGFRHRSPVFAGIPTRLGVIPLDEWFDAYGPGLGGRFRYVTTLAKIAVRRATAKIVDAIDGEIRAEEAASLDPALRVKVALLLDQPYTPPVARRLERLLDAVLSLLRALGPARDRVKGGRKVGGFAQPGLYQPGVSWGTNPGYDAPLPPAVADLTGLWGGSSISDYADSTADEADEDSGDEDGQPLVTSPPVETFGAKIIREIMAMAPVLMNAQRNTPENMVLAIVAAEREGMPKLAAKLRKLMGLEKAEDQETPKPAFGMSGMLRPFVAPDEVNGAGPFVDSHEEHCKHGAGCEPDRQAAVTS